MTGTQFRSPLHQHSKKKGSSSNEIMLHKVLNITGSERTLEKTIHHTCIVCGD